MEKRSRPYIWPTWITGLMSGEDHCRWAAWVKAHFKYEKRPDDGGSDALSRWMVKHDELVATRVEELDADGWHVLVEDQNKFTVRGRTTIGGKPDIIATRDNECLISDAKGGKRKHKYVWQMREYMVLVPLANMSYAGMRIIGELVYPDGREFVTLQPGDEERIYEQIREIGEGDEPSAVPSESECRYCDIAECRVRFEGESSSGTSRGRF